MLTAPRPTGPHSTSYFHTADFRQGVGQVGWYDKPRVAVFLWRLKELQNLSRFSRSPCSTYPPGWYTFDPTGRDIALFGQDSRATG